MKSDSIERLVAELKAIELWDTEYYRDASADAIDIAALHHRHRRRKEIISEIVKLAQGLDQISLEPWNSHNAAL